ncbi:unnamed protein product [Didymodactylos carnosus]|uniref:Cadherin domain-containing protein n=1 Tax=Didymodactylos carnosus TaxID=1234261 RepID=A0A8S2H5C1_9BILA|nr:unnamed protein product [Didymodactylos carnosus]CAF3580659.1 unnamed protein product [Didymodactylos carnosus]CAF4336291.1 unnamed protein product [Didymodactylos carnosus]
MMILLLLSSFICLTKSIPTLRSTYAVVIPEKSPVNITILSLNSEYSLPTTTYQLINTHSNLISSYFQIQSSGNLVLKQSIDRDQWCQLGYCSCDVCSLMSQIIIDDQQFEHPKFSSINITITDINDHHPQFFDINEIKLSENIPLRHRFRIGRAIDLDSGINSQLKFRLTCLTCTSTSNPFELSVTSLSANEYLLNGIVTQLLDRETVSQYSLSLEATDGGTLPLSNSTNITISVQDENDNAPKLNQSEYSIKNLREDTPIGTNLLTIFATDADEGLNGLVRYLIVDRHSPFSINSTTGVVQLTSPLDYEQCRWYRLLIRATDCGLVPLSTDVWLTISIADVNDCPPDIIFFPQRRLQYSNSTLMVSENIPVNTTLGYYSISDQDSYDVSGDLSATIQTNNSWFKLISNGFNSYALITVSELDRETIPSIRIIFIARDSGKPQPLLSSYELNIVLLDINDNPPLFSSDPVIFYVEETAYYVMKKFMDIKQDGDQNLTIGYLHAVDADINENAISTYHIETNEFVKIDSKTGLLSLFQPMDREQISLVNISGYARNVAKPYWRTNVTISIKITDVNDNVPRCSQLVYQLEYAENQTVDQPLLTINGSDLDYGENSTILYSLVNTNPTWPFQIDVNKGVLYSQRTFDYEVISQYNLTIELADKGYPVSLNSKCSVEIHILDVNDNIPQLIYPADGQIFINREQRKQGFLINLLARDDDSGLNGLVRYRLQSIQSYQSISDDELEKTHLFNREGYRQKQQQKKQNRQKISLHNQLPFTLLTNGSLYINEVVDKISLFKLRIVLEDSGSPSQRSLVTLTIGIGDSIIKSIDNVQSVISEIEHLRARPTYISLILGLTVLCILFLFFMFVSIFCAMRHHRQRRQQRRNLLKLKHNDGEQNHSGISKFFCSQLTPSISSESSSTATTDGSGNDDKHHHDQNQKVIIRASDQDRWDEKESTISANSQEKYSMSYNDDSASPESRTYKILHLPYSNENYWSSQEPFTSNLSKNVSSSHTVIQDLNPQLEQTLTVRNDEGYYGSNETGSDSNSFDIAQRQANLSNWPSTSTKLPNFYVNQLLFSTHTLPPFVTMCQRIGEPSTNGGFLEMSVDESDIEV